MRSAIALFLPQLSEMHPSGAESLITNIYITDRSNASNIVSDYAIDIWDTRGNKVFTITPSYLKPFAPGATPFSNTGAGGSNLP